ncbi:hypothetical protein, partial [Vibrio parahaemolyticus]|uniref:hypothetical protein n=1 Tax=Vibrio parahaemolyticus TaxID=670 RepID=UPI002114C588
PTALELRLVDDVVDVRCLVLFIVVVVDVCVYCGVCFVLCVVFYVIDVGVVCGDWCDDLLYGVLDFLSIFA